MFPSWVKHFTDKVETEKERITIAFDIRTENAYKESVKEGLKEHWIKL